MGPQVTLQVFRKCDRSHPLSFLSPEQVVWPVRERQGVTGNLPEVALLDSREDPSNVLPGGYMLRFWHPGSSREKGWEAVVTQASLSAPHLSLPQPDASCLPQGWAGGTCSAESCGNLWECISFLCSVAKSNTHLLFQSLGLGVWLSRPSALGLKQLPPRCHPLCTRVSWGNTSASELTGLLAGFMLLWPSDQGPQLLAGCAGGRPLSLATRAWLLASPSPQRDPPLGLLRQRVAVFDWSEASHSRGRDGGGCEYLWGSGSHWGHRKICLPKGLSSDVTPASYGAQT